MMKGEWKWILACGAVSLTLVGFITGFRYQEFELQFHETYLVLRPDHAVYHFAIALWMARSCYLLLDLFTRRNPVAALVFSIVNALVTLFVAIVLALNIAMLFDGDGQPSGLSGLIAATVILTGILGLLVVLEFLALKSVRQWLRPGGSSASSNG